MDVVEGLEGCHSANISPDNRTLWVPALKQDRICLFTLGEDGNLTAQEPAEVTTVEGAGPRHIAFHPNQRYAYCVNELNSSVDVWQLSDAHGNIDCVQTLDMMPADFSDTRWAADIHITPDGRHLYACDRTSSLLTIFSVSEDGSVLAVEGFQPTETQPRGFNVDHTGKFLIAAGQKSHHIALYEIAGEQGLLTEKGRYAVGRGADVGGGERVLSLHFGHKKTSLWRGFLSSTTHYFFGTATTLLPTPRLLNSHIRLNCGLFSSRCTLPLSSTVPVLPA